MPDEIIELLITCPKCEHTHTVEVQENDLKPNREEEKLYRLKDLQQILGLSRRTLKEHIYMGHLKAFKPGRDRRWHIKASDLRDFRRWRGEM